MKAYSVRDKNSDCFTIVFAESVNKAKVIALHTDACEDSYYTDIRTKRIPDLDKYYRVGKKEMDWFDDADRIALVRDAGYSCDPEYWEHIMCMWILSVRRVRCCIAAPTLLLRNRH